MGVLSPYEGYKSMVKYASHKAKLPIDRLILQSFMAGLWVAVYGHCCTYFSGLFYSPTSSVPSAIPKLMYGILFPGAFIAVSFTGTELFTGNTVTMMLFLLNGLKKGNRLLRFLASVRIWMLSLLGNLIGAVIGALILSHLSGVFYEQPQGAFLNALGEGKVKHGFVPNLVLAIGCNMLVCLATWCTLIIEDGAGKILAMWFTVGVFAMGGFEHIVANFYTLALYLMQSAHPYPLSSVILYNWLPVCLGNVIAGFLFTAGTWWYALSPLPTRAVDDIYDEIFVDGVTLEKESSTIKVVV